MTVRHKLDDVVVVLPGIMGSTLSYRGQLVWAPSAGALIRAIRTFGGSIKDLTLPYDVGDQHPRDGVEPISLMPDLHLLPGLWTANIGYDSLVRWLATRFTLSLPDRDHPERIPNLLPVAYDWRLSNRYNARRLKHIVEPALERWRAQGGPYAQARFIFICHSMGGLLARQYIEHEGGAEITNKLITLGTPYRGALAALAQLVNGVRKAIGPLAIDLSHFVRSLPSVYQLLPEYACVESPEGLAKITEVAIPLLDREMVADGVRFHEAQDDTTHSRADLSYDLHPIVGSWQRTETTAAVIGDRIEPQCQIEGEDEGGDGTVPRLSGTPKELRPNSPNIRWIPDRHGSLQSNPAALDEIEGILTARPVIHRAGHAIKIRVDVETLLLSGEDVVVSAAVLNDRRVALVATLRNEQGVKIAQAPMRASEHEFRARFHPPKPGGYMVNVSGVGSAAGLVSPVSCSLLVWDQVSQ